MRVFIVIVAILFSAVPVKAQSYVELQNLLTSSGYVPQIDGYVSVPGKGVNTDVWFLATKNWGEVVIGPSKSFNSGFGASFLVGVESSDRGYWRINPNAWLYRGKLGTYHAFEWGASGFWYKSTATWTVNKHLAVGVHSQRFYGTGPLVSVPINNTYRVWASTVRSNGQNKAMIGLVRNF